MSKRTVTTAELKAHLDEQLLFMRSSAEAFDRGFHGEAKRLAVSARILLHQTAVSHSLLGQLGLRSRQDFVDTGQPHDQRNLLTHTGLVGLRASDGQPSYFALLDSFPHTFRKFSDWWETDIVLDSRDGTTFTRKGLVLALSNKDGGAHVDPELDEAYANLKYGNAMRWEFKNGNSGDVTPIPDVELHSMRQIAYEILATLTPGEDKA